MSYAVSCQSFKIVTYVSAGFADALRLTLPSWLARSGAGSITVYADCALAPEFKDVQWCNVFAPSEDPATCWRRKIECLRDVYDRNAAQCFAWLDADVYCRAPFAEVFERMNDMAATRMFNRSNRGYGAINAGVLFFRRTVNLAQFFDDWSALTEANEKAGLKWAEQSAVSQLAHEAYHGLRPYYCAPVSENLYNLEDDSNAAWLGRITQYHPKLVHFKGTRWRDAEIVARAHTAMGGY